MREAETAEENAVYLLEADIFRDTKPVVIDEGISGACIAIDESNGITIAGGGKISSDTGGNFSFPHPSPSSIERELALMALEINVVGTVGCGLGSNVLLPCGGDIGI
mmetsp:Transcript_9290/g.17404  ORF Transcript_9290/g.17404 Transcript_9290/m.17404 type:complete len:107 (-) Transcript_9290:1940-2260(-)